MAYRKLLKVAVAVALAAGCQQQDDPTFSYYEERIGPVLTNGCSRGPSGGGCHLPREDGTALGNLDVSSFDALMRRDDVLAPYGPYSVGLLLLKAGEQVDVTVETWADDPDARLVDVTTDIRHNNGATINLGSSAYAQLKQWIEAGHTRSGVQDETLAENEGDLIGGVPGHPLYDPSFADTYRDDFDRFVADVQPILLDSCAGSSCHGSTIADLFINAGTDDDERRWNFWVSVQHLTSPVSTSGLLRRPLSTYRGGVFHEGGNVFADAEDDRYVAIRTWAEQLVADHPEAIAPPTDGVTEGLRYFANRVQPMMVRKGCMFLNCHSRSMFHELRLQGGAQGVFSRIATYENWEASRLLLALDATTPNESRIVAKNLYPPEQVSGMPGIFHRGGSLFEDFGMAADGRPNGASPDDCAGFDADAGDLNEVPAYCIMLRWWEIERQEAVANGEIFDPAVEIVRSVVWVARPTGVGDPRDFDTYRPGADLLMAPATVDTATGDMTIGAPSSVLGGCGLDPSTADVRGPAVSWDGERVAFSARSSAGEPHRLYWFNSADGSGCERIGGIAPSMDSQNGILTHDIDPAFAPDGRIVFASTRGNLDPDILGSEFAGPTRTPAAMQPNANLYVQEADGSIRQMTYLLNQEYHPSFMTDGRLVMTTEKREPDFHQLAGRRQNLDGGDYHPLFAQRGTVGYEAATEIMEMLDRNFVMVASPIDAADGAGRIVVANRSIGPDQDDRDPGDRFYISSQRFMSAEGSGVFRSPYPLPTGRILASCDEDAGDPTAGGFDFDLCEIDPSTNARRVLVSTGQAEIEAVAVYARADREIFESKIDEVNATTRVDATATDAQVNVVDFPLLATLLFENTRTGRDIDYDVGGIDVYAEYPPPVSATTFGDAGGNVISDDYGMMYLDRRLLGHVDLNADGSAHFAYRGGLPIVLGVTGWDGSQLQFGEGAPFAGDMIQREQMQFYPGERIRQSFRRELFNGMCGGCHGSISNRELDVAVQVDVLTAASSRVMSIGQGPTGL